MRCELVVGSLVDSTQIPVSARDFRLPQTVRNFRLHRAGAQPQLSCYHGVRKKPGREQVKRGFIFSLEAIKLRHTNSQLLLVHGSTKYSRMLWAHKGKEKNWKVLLVWEGWAPSGSWRRLLFSHCNIQTLLLLLTICFWLHDTAIHDCKNYGKLSIQKGAVSSSRWLGSCHGNMRKTRGILPPILKKKADVPVTRTRCAPSYSWAKKQERIREPSNLSTLILQF